MRRLLLLVLLFASACGRSGPTASDATPSPTTGGSTTADARRADGTVAPGASPRGEADPGGESTEGPSEPLAAGTWSYRSTFDFGGPAKLDGERTLQAFAPVPGSPTRQTHKHTVKVGPKDPSVSWYRYAWRASGLYLERQIVEGRPCTLDRPLRVVPFPLEVGRSWTSRATCTESGKEQSVDMRVVRTEAVTVGDRTIETFVLDGTTVMIGGSGNPSRLRETHWFSDALRLRVKMRTRTPEGSAHFGLDEVLKATSPGPPPTEAPPPGF